MSYVSLILDVKISRAKLDFALLISSIFFPQIDGQLMDKSADFPTFFPAFFSGSLDFCRSLANSDVKKKMTGKLTEFYASIDGKLLNDIDSFCQKLID